MFISVVVLDVGHGVRVFTTRDTISLSCQNEQVAEFVSTKVRGFALLEFAFGIFSSWVISGGNFVKELLGIFQMIVKEFLGIVWGNFKSCLWMTLKSLLVSLAIFMT